MKDEMTKQERAARKAISSEIDSLNAAKPTLCEHCERERPLGISPEALADPKNEMDRYRASLKPVHAQCLSEYRRLAAEWIRLLDGRAQKDQIKREFERINADRRVRRVAELAWEEFTRGDAFPDVRQSIPLGEVERALRRLGYPQCAKCSSWNVWDITHPTTKSPYLQCRDCGDERLDMLAIGRTE